MIKFELRGGNLIFVSNDNEEPLPRSLRFSFNKEDIFCFANKAYNTNPVRYTDVIIKEGVTVNVRLNDELKYRNLSNAIFTEVTHGIYRLDKSRSC